SLFRRKLLEHIEGIVRESVKPMEKIEGIRILHVDGLNGGGTGGNGRNATDEVIDSALRYRVQAPLIDSVLSEIGIEGGSLSRMQGLIREALDLQGIRKDVAPKSPPAGPPESPPEGGGGSPRKKS
ncbi:MAG: flotillin domain-containing protein, partial [Roseiarcus sp.]